MRKLILFNLFAFSLCYNEAHAQFEHKVTAYGFLGVPIFKRAGEIQAENIYNGYSSIPYLGFGVNYNFNTHFAIGANIKQLVTKKPNYTLANTNFGIGAKYNFLPADMKISPFAYGEANIGYINISQKANTTLEYPQVDGQEHVKYIEQVRNYPEIRTGYSAFGVMVGAGVDFTLRLKYGAFVSLNYMLTNAHQTLASTTNFEDNTSKFDFFMIQTGFRFSFGKSKSLY